MAIADSGDSYYQALLVFEHVHPCCRVFEPSKVANVGLKGYWHCSSVLWGVGTDCSPPSTSIMPGLCNILPVLPVLPYYGRTVPSSSRGKTNMVRLRVTRTRQASVHFTAVPVYGYGGHP